MRVRLKLLLCILIFVLMYASYYWGIPSIVNIQGRVAQIQNYVKKTQGFDIELKNPRLKMGLTPSVWLKADSFSIKDKSETPFSVNQPKIKIKLLPLIYGKVKLAYFSCGDLTVDARIDKKNRLYIGNYLLKQEKSNVSVDNSKMFVDKYKIHLKDDVQDKNIFIDGDYFDVEKYNSKKQLKFSTVGRIKVGKNVSSVNANVDVKLPLKKGLSTNDIVFAGSVSNLNLADFSAYIKKFSKDRIKKTSGVLNIQANTKTLSKKTTQIVSQIRINDFAIIGKDKASSVYFKKKLVADTICEFSKNKLEFKKFKIKSGSINLDVTGNIRKISSKYPTFDVGVKIGKSRSEDFISLVPAINISNLGINLIAMKKYGIYGDASGNIFIKGRKTQKVTGNFELDNGYVIKPLPNNVKKANLKIKFLGDKLYLDVKFPVTHKEIVYVTGTFDIFNGKNADVSVKSTSQVDLHTVQCLILPIHEIFYFELGPLPIMKVDGVGNVNMRITGPQLMPKVYGDINFKKASASFDGLAAQIKNADATLYFKDMGVHFVTHSAYLNGKNIGINGKASANGNLDFDVITNGQNLNDLIKLLKTSPMLKNFGTPLPPINKISGKTNLAVKLKGNVVDINNFELGKNVMASGTLKLLGDGVSISDLDIPIKNIFGSIKFKNTDADFDLYSFLQKNRLVVKGKVRNGVLTSRIKLDDLIFSCMNIPVQIYSGSIEIKKDKLYLYKINAIMDSMPVLLDGTIKDIFKNPSMDLYLNSKPSQRFIEKYINKNAYYPLKVKGDIIYSSRIRGTKDAFNVKTQVNMQEDSSIYYMGSTIGDVNNPIKLYLDANVLKNQKAKKPSAIVNVNNFQYDKLISSQNNKEFISPQLNAKGQINFSGSNISFHNFRVKTQNPTDAKIFNLLFKKSLIKQGLFSSNIIINNSIMAPKILGFLNFTGIDIPLLDTTIKDISLNFRNNTIDLKSKGEIFSNRIILMATIDNKLTPPYKIDDMDVYLGNLDINEIVKTLNKLDLENMNNLAERSDGDSFNITDLIIKKAKIKAESVFVKNIFATNFVSDLELSDKLVFSFKNFKFNVAQGHVSGDFNYNLLNSKTDLNIHVDKVNANSMSDALFDLPNQVFGSLNGQADLTCNGRTHKTCMETLTGRGGFNIADGKMPKLGSLEYLLKAANLVKSGFTGITLNSIIDIISPLKTGQFESINGMFDIKSGIANDVQVFSKGKDLSIFLTGTYNFSTLIADMKVFGRLSKKINNVLGSIGNTSLNTLFNTIPGLNLDDSNRVELIKNFNKIPGFELNDKTYRIFSAEIYGDINGDNYVQSFKWVE